MQVFWRQGYAATSLQQLLDAMDLSKSSFYQAFGSKQRLFERCIEHFRDDQVHRLRQALEQAGSGRVFLEQCLHTLAEEARGPQKPRGCLIMNTATEFAGREPAVAQQVATSIERLTGVFVAAVQRAQAEGDIPAGHDAPVLARYLVEHLPFEAEPEQQIDTVRLVLQPGLLDPWEIDGLWRKAQRKPAYYVGFLAARPDDLPAPLAAHPAHATLAAGAGTETTAPLRALLLRALSSAGQTYLDTVQRVFDKPSNQDVVNLALDLVADYFAAARPEGKADLTLPELLADADSWLQRSTEASGLCAVDGIDGAQVRALRVLAGLGYGVVRPVFSDSTAIGSLMRRKLQPVLAPMLDALQRLR